MTRALIWTVVVAAFLRFGLEPLGWAFYEAHFASGLDWLYWGYSGFRGAGYALSLWDYQNIFCLGAGVLVGLLVLWRTKRREAKT